MRKDYKGFDNWLKRKADKNAYVVFNESKKITAFLYLKVESGVEDGVIPELFGKRIKIGTFKVDDLEHSGTSLGKRFLAIALRSFVVNDDFEKIYVTVFEKQKVLISLFKKYGFVEFGEKGSSFEAEKVFVKTRQIKNEPYKDYPFVNATKRKFLLSIFPEYHNKMFSESEVRTETSQSDLSVYNNIEKIYLSASSKVQNLQVGDLLIPYRIGDGRGPAYYRSIVSAVGTVVEVNHISSFASEKFFKDYVRENSVFSEKELSSFWMSKHYPWIIKFLYNVPFNKYPNRKLLLENNVITDDRIVITEISQSSFKEIIRLGEVNESYFID